MEDIKGYIWLNGQFINWEEAKIHVLTHSLHYGGAVFEGIKAINLKIFKPEQHINRLFNSARQMKLEIPYTNQELITAMGKLLEKNNLSHKAYIRPLVWRNSETLMVSPPSFIANIMIAAWEPRKKLTSNPLNITVSQWIKPSPNMLPIQCKSASHYSMMVIISLEAKAQGFDDALTLDNRGFISECTTSNIFFIDKFNNIITPTTVNCLNGITRQTIIEIAKKNNINLIEKDVALADLNNIKSAFISGTACGIKEIGSITSQGKKFELTNHKLTDILKTEYQLLLEN